MLRELQPLGVILFERNVQDRQQLLDLTRAIRQALGRADAPILVDQEGGRVQRLRPPNWLHYPPLAALGGSDYHDPSVALEYSAWQGRAIGDDLTEVGISVVCAPVLDLKHPYADQVIGDRSFHSDPTVVTRLAGVMASGFRKAGVIPILKHIPGHGRATADSHHQLPRIATGLEELKRSDFVPFRDITDRDRAWAMTAHIVYDAADPQLPLTLSARAIETLVRQAIGFDGILISDDLNMKALQGSLGDLTQQALAAGCDLVLECSGLIDKSREVLTAAPPLSALAKQRLARSQIRPEERREQMSPESRPKDLEDFTERYRQASERRASDHQASEHLATDHPPLNLQNRDPTT